MSAAASTDEPIRLSIIIPVYNNPDHIRTAIEGAVRQTVPGGRTEVVVVNDGSTDGTVGVLAELESLHRNLTVIHQKNSGWAGAPRNTGLDHALGDYVFFHDADDQLDGDCLGSAVAFADEHDSDVVLVGIEGRGGRHTHADVFESTQVDGDIRKLVRSNFCFKLFRREFLNAHDVRFPEHKIRLEDAQFCFRAYSLASRVSILADRTYYFVYNHGAGTSHISHSGVSAELHAEGIKKSLEPLRSGPWDDAQRREAMADYFRRVTLLRFNGHFGKRSLNYRLGWIREASRLVHEFALPERLHEFYTPTNLARVWSLRRPVPALVEAVGRQSFRNPVVVAEVDEVRVGAFHVELNGIATALMATEDFDRLVIQLRHGADTISEVAATLGPEITETVANAAKRFSVRIPLAPLLRHRSVKLYASALDSQGTETKVLRVGLAADVAPQSHRLLPGTEVFPTVLGGLNIRLGLGARSVLTRVLERVKKP